MIAVAGNVLPFRLVLLENLALGVVADVTNGNEAAQIERLRACSEGCHDG